MTENIFLQILIVFGFTILVTYISTLLRFPVIIAFILSGVVIGPNGLKLISHNALIDNMAEIGLAMLLFTIGLEFSKEKVRNLRRYFFRGGPLLLYGIILLFLGLFLATGRSFSEGLLFSFLISLSSSALAFEILKQKGILHSPRGNFIVAIQLFGDVNFVPMIMVLPLLSRFNIYRSVSPLVLAVYLAAFLLLALLFKIYGDRFFHFLSSERYRVLNLMIAILFPFAFSILSNQAGFSYAFGAFVAGVLISETDFQLRVTSDIMPFKEIFTAFFFVATGMLFEFGSLGARWGEILLLLAAILLLKGGLIFLVARSFRISKTHSLQTAAYIFQMSEFSIALLKISINNGILASETFNVFFSATIISILMTPLLIEAAERLTASSSDDSPNRQENLVLRKHTIVAGYGLTGRNLALALKKVKIPFLVVDLNYENVKLLRSEQMPVFFGDISGEEVLDKVNIREATVLVVAISDPRAAKVAISKAHEKNPYLQIIARTRYLAEIEDLYRIGANEVIGEEFETSIEIFSRTLRHYHIPGNVVENIVKIIRNKNYAILRGRSTVDTRWEKLNALIEAGTVETFLIDEEMFACEKSLQELDLRQKTGATVVAVVRAGKSFPSPRADFRIGANDILVLTAAHQNLERACLYLENGKSDGSDASLQIHDRG